MEDLLNEKVNIEYNDLDNFPFKLYAIFSL